MKVAMMIDGDGNSTLVDSELRPLGKEDVGHPTLHILPKLFVHGRDTAYLRCSDMQLVVTSNIDIPMPQAIGVTQPYPNYSYYVGGTEGSRNGWLVDLPDDSPQSFWVRFLWTIDVLPGSQLDSGRLVAGGVRWVEHTVDIEICEGEGNVHSMDPCNWAYSAERAPPLLTSAIGFADLRGDAVLPTADRDSLVIEQDGATIRMRERMMIRGVPLAQAWTVGAFQDLQLHEQRPVVNFELDELTLMHRRNASVEVPSEMFIDAVNAAWSFSEEDVEAAAKAAPGVFEEHDALRKICSWLNSNRSPEAHLEIGSFMPHVRVSADGPYWCADRQVPNCEIEGYCESVNAARVGDVVLLELRAAQRHAQLDDNGLGVLGPNGREVYSIGITADDYLDRRFDSAYDCICALRDFRLNFPAAWQAITASSAK
jgi:hypothetical protein